MSAQAEPSPGSSPPAPAPDRTGPQALSQIEFDIQFFGRVLEGAPEFVDVLRCQGQLLAAKGLHERALAIDQRLVALLPRDSVAHYNLACSLALGCRTPEALAALRRAFEMGYDDFDYIEIDHDLDGLRRLPEYCALVEEFSGRR